jgi:hypothetical protein
MEIVAKFGVGPLYGGLSVCRRVRTCRFEPSFNAMGTLSKVIGDPADVPDLRLERYPRSRCDEQSANDIHKSGERGGSTESERVEEEASNRQIAVWVF